MAGSRRGIRHLTFAGQPCGKRTDRPIRGQTCFAAGGQFVYPQVGVGDDQHAAAVPGQLRRAVGPKRAFLDRLNGLHGTVAQDPDQLVGLCTIHTGQVEQRAIAGDVKTCGIHSRRGDTQAHAFGQRDRAAGRLECSRVKRDGEERVVHGVDDVAIHILAIGAALNHDAALAAAGGLHGEHRARLTWRYRRPIHREEHGFAVRQELRAGILLSVRPRDHNLRDRRHRPGRARCRRAMRNRWRCRQPN